MIVDNFNVKRVSIFPQEANPPLVIDPNAVLPLTISTQRFEPVARRGGQIAQFRRRVELSQLPQSGPFDGLEAPRGKPLKQPFSFLATERLDHLSRV